MFLVVIHTNMFLKFFDQYSEILDIIFKSFSFIQNSNNNLPYSKKKTRTIELQNVKKSKNTPGSTKFSCFFKNWYYEIDEIDWYYKIEIYNLISFSKQPKHHQPSRLYFFVFILHSPFSYSAAEYFFSSTKTLSLCPWPI